MVITVFNYFAIFVIILVICFALSVPLRHCPGYATAMRRMGDCLRAVHLPALALVSRMGNLKTCSVLAQKIILNALGMLCTLHALTNRMYGLFIPDSVVLDSAAFNCLLVQKASLSPS
jgi:hypothetical protein